MTTHVISANDIAAHGLIVTSGQVVTVQFETNIATVDIISDGRASVYYTVNRGEPTVGGPNCYLLPAGAMSVDTRTADNDVAKLDTVKLISDGEATVSVQVGQ